MSQLISLQVAPRTAAGKAMAARLRREGLLPGVVYGYNVQEALPVQVDRRAFEVAYRRAGSTQLIDLQVEGGGRPTKVFVHKVTRHPVHHELTHVDFMAVNLTVRVTADVPLVFTGEAPAVKGGDALVQHLLDTVHVRALPDHLPHNVHMDLSGLTEIGQTLTVADLQLPSDVEMLTDPETPVVRIIMVQAVEEEEEEAAEAAEAAAAEAEAAEGEAEES